MSDPTANVTSAPIFEAPDAGTAAAAPEYEFGEAANETFRRLAAAMRFVGAGNMVLGGVLFALALVGLFLAGHGGFLAALGQSAAGAVLLVTGVWLRHAAASVARIVATQGSDVTNLMAAMADLLKMFALQRTLMLALACVVAPLVAVGFVAATLLGRTGHG